MRASGPLAGVRYLLDGPVTRVGRNPDNDVVIRGPDIAVVSGRHAEIEAAGDGFRVRDLDSTNGTYVDGQRISEMVVQPPCTIQLGTGGPELLLTLEHRPAEEELLDQTVEAPGIAAEASLDENDALLRQAVAQARVARGGGVTGQTMTIMREAIRTAVGKTKRRSKRVIAALVLLLAGVSGYSTWQIYTLRQAKGAIDAHIRDIEARLANAAEGSPEAEELIKTLERYQDEGQALERNVFYRISDWRKEQSIRNEIRLLLAEFGAEVYSVPPEFVDSVDKFITQFQGPDRPNMARALGQARPVMQQMRKTFEERKLPPDLAYMAVAESALKGKDVSAAGAAGLWQFTPATARAFGLRVEDAVDERHDAGKATAAAAKYVRELILDFGAGSSVMLAMAAYNVGPARVKTAIRRMADDPIKQRSFWYLYRRRALPAETREYVPKVFAAMIIGRNPEKFGF